MIPQEKQRMTPEDYLEFEKNSELKHEYFDGEIFAMVGARKNHNRVSSNTSRILGNQLLNRPCDVFISDMRVKIPEIEKYTYPDIVVACDKVEFIEEELDSLLNPVVIIEILSDTTESYDRGLKFTHYRLIESLQEYILISQYHCQVEKFKRDKEGTWVYSSVEDMKASVKIDSINCELALSEIYYRVEF
ncbi:MAG: Uma2 family endonuclease [Desulfamplus sp.]|nr:Uma2 family endonuclease [Desulfamplus sp.]